MRNAACYSSSRPQMAAALHGGPSPGAPKGNRNAYKHGRFTAERAAQGCEGRPNGDKPNRVRPVSF
jgi:hypothetical protein